ncbi:hypothetical protein [Gracilibacillus dipsosauri]|uniref:hypothetical protein n=1 Tax=Gracilibacillus dipsosauri TaxID=178340 RepID=UPI002409DCD6
MKKLLFIFVSLIMLVACGNEDTIKVNGNNENDNDISNPEIEEDEIETLFSKDMNLTIADNADLKINLLQVGHGRADATDYISLRVEIENKQNKTFEFYIKDLKVDGQHVDDIHSWIGEGEIKPNETIEVFINGYEYEELSINEHVSGRLIYLDYESNRYEIEFSEYINE